MDWTPTQDARLRKCLDDGLSASQIAARLKVSRNAVIGRKHRIKGTQFPCDKVREERERRRHEETISARKAQLRLYAKCNISLVETDETG